MPEPPPLIIEWPKGERMGKEGTMPTPVFQRVGIAISLFSDFLSVPEEVVDIAKRIGREATHHIKIIGGDASTSHIAPGCHVGDVHSR